MSREGQESDTRKAKSEKKGVQEKTRDQEGSRSIQENHNEKGSGQAASALRQEANAQDGTKGFCVYSKKVCKGYIEE